MLPAVVDPTYCPTCRSQDLVAPEKKVDAEAYWRCRKCGDMWNVSRMQKTDSGYSQPFGRERVRSW